MPCIKILMFECDFNKEKCLEWLHELIPALAVLFPNENNPDITKQQCLVPTRRGLPAVNEVRYFSSRFQVKTDRRRRLDAMVGFQIHDFFLWTRLKIKMDINRLNNFLIS